MIRAIIINKKALARGATKLELLKRAVVVLLTTDFSEASIDTMLMHTNASGIIQKSSEKIGPTVNEVMPGRAFAQKRRCGTSVGDISIKQAIKKHVGDNQHPHERVLH